MENVLLESSREANDRKYLWLRSAFIELKRRQSSAFVSRSRLRLGRLDLDQGTTWGTELLQLGPRLPCSQRRGQLAQPVRRWSAGRNPNRYMKVSRPAVHRTAQIRPA